jgi:hypothetical protein
MLRLVNRRLVALAGFALVLGACRGHSGGAKAPCNVTYNCAAGQTCTKMDPNEPFTCLPAGPGKPGDPCYATPDAPVTCGEHLTCLAMGNPQRGSCVAWCDDTHPCAGDTQCTTVTTTIGDKLHICAPCNVAYVCGNGQTCATRDGTSFGCVPAGKGKLSTPCDVSVGAPVTCGEEMLCFSMAGPAAGTCTRWCDRTHPCPGGKTCTSLKTTKGAAISVCL